MSFLKIKCFRCFKAYSSDRISTSIYPEIQLSCKLEQSYIHKDSCLIVKSGGKSLKGIYLCAATPSCATWNCFENHSSLGVTIGSRVSLSGCFKETLPMLSQSCQKGRAWPGMKHIIPSQLCIPRSFNTPKANAL